MAVEQSQSARPRLSMRIPEFFKDPVTVFACCIVFAFFFLGFFGEYLAPYKITMLDMAHRFASPSAAHWFGTDNLGRDTFSRVLAGTRVALTVSILAIGASVSCGIVLGLLAGYGPRWLDNLLMLLLDSIYSFPYIMLALAAITLFGSSQFIVVLVVAITTMPTYARLIRTSTLSVRNHEYILAARSMNIGHLQIVLRHILPNVIGPVFILVSMDIPVVITVEAALSFLGLGVPPPAPSWGRMLNDGYTLIRQTPWLVIAGGIPLMLTTLGFTLLGEKLRDVLDPKLQVRRA
ncbi:ABC transporter permease [Dongia soli]|uniref:ABC transporter permease n=1 Tax=Dongia soli TaxID=600628 RepID=A0ABU5E7R4_9PROT|nr:ABC transporter permease [Dongia soli]MDY0881598.1 ABC transporter permease [Dongia soli]